MMFRLTKRNRQEGAALVEFALILPLFLLLVFGIMEAGWLFAQQVEIRNAAREGARLAVVDWGTAAQVGAETCDRADISGADATVTVTPSTTIDNGFDPASPESVTVTVAKTYDSLTGFLDFAFGDLPMSAVAEMRTERPLVTLGGGAAVTCS